MNQRITPRGFRRLEFVDNCYEESCSLQESSLDTGAGPCVWLGRDGVGDVPARMHLTQEQVRELLPYLERFANSEDGKIGDW